MDNLLEEIKELATKHKVETNECFTNKMCYVLEISEFISDIANIIINDPDSLFNNMPGEFESFLVNNKDEFYKTIQVFNNIYNDEEVYDFLRYKALTYDIFEIVFLQKDFSVGLSHYYSLNIYYNILVDISTESVSQLNTEMLASLSDSKFETLKLKNQLTCSLVSLIKNKDISFFRVDKYLNSIELAKKIVAIYNSQSQSKPPINNNKSSKQNKPDSIIDFLVDNNNNQLILKIQSTFISCRGKRLAILTYLLKEEYNIISIISNSKTHSRKRFLQLFINDNTVNNFEPVNKYIDSFTNELNLPTIKESDSDYIDIKQKLTKIIENPVV